MNDVHDTPYSASLSGAGGVLMTGSEIQASIVETLLSGTVIAPVSKGVRWGVCLLLIALTLLLYRNLSPWSGWEFWPLPAQQHCCWPGRFSKDFGSFRQRICNWDY